MIYTIAMNPDEGRQPGELCGHVVFDYQCEDCQLSYPHFDSSPEQDEYDNIRWLKDKDAVIVELEKPF